MFNLFNVPRSKVTFIQENSISLTLWHKDFKNDLKKKILCMLVRINNIETGKWNGIRFTNISVKYG